MNSSANNIDFRKKLIETYGSDAKAGTKASQDWVETIEKILNLSSIQEHPNQTQKLFSSFFQSFLTFAQMRLDALLLKYESFQRNRDSLMHGWYEELYSKLFNLSVRTLIQELHIARLSGILQGDTPGDRYQHYNTVLLNDKAYVESVFMMYPVLAKLMTEETTRFIEYHTEIITNLNKDLNILQNEFNREYLLLERISTGVGDTHSKGRSVSILYFGDGNKLIYKPRSLKIDTGFEKLMNWVHETNHTMNYKTTKSVDCGSYGWQSYVEYTSCSSKEEVDRYYHRYGGYVALLYVLGSRDFHFENIIADGEFPILIDMETLFSNRVVSETNEDWRKVFLDEMDRSVFSSMLIPFKRTPQEDTDTSGLGNWGDQNNELISEVIDSPFTDEMKLVNKKITKEPGRNRPQLQGQYIGFEMYITQIQEGFAEMYQFINACKDEFASVHGPLKDFEDVSVRMIFRSTNDYGEFLKSSLHPDYLQKLSKRIQLFEHFQRSSVYTPYYSKIVPYEMDCLLQQEIPVFNFDMESRHITIQSSKEIVHLGFKAAGLERVHEQLDRLSKQDFEKQLRYLKMSLTSFGKSLNGMNSNAAQQQVDSHGDFLQAAKRIGDELIAHAAWDQDKKTIIWVDRKPIADGGHYIGILEPSLYDGSLGIVLFLAYLGSESGDSRYSAFAKEALQTCLDTITDVQERNLSLFSGLLGYAYTLIQVSFLWKEQKYYKEALTYIDKIRSIIKDDKQLDVVGGSAGAVLLLTQLYSQTSNAEFKLLACECGEHLKRELEDRMENNKVLLNGLSHGLSGYAWAFVELWAITGLQEYKSFAKLLLEMERRDYSRTNNNWRDKRSEQPNEFQAVYWCHGAPGIGLSRLHMLQRIDDSDMLAEIDAAKSKIIEDGLHLPPFMCHGSLGNIDILLSMENILGSARDSKTAQELGFEICLKYNKISAKDFPLGLMTGMAGFGYGLLRLNNPEIPSILSLEIPELNV